jgi:hypothetical protein
MRLCFDSQRRQKYSRLTLGFNITSSAASRATKFGGGNEAYTDALRLLRMKCKTTSMTTPMMNNTTPF